ncbi:hypothetical protein EV206_108150 [Flavonifractor plautii DSM 6740]|nr:hypothetical protein EV206_108150 [Flavonifractor plautii DSM 6740]
MSRMYRKTILVIEHDGLAVRAFTIAFALRSPDFDWKAAVKAACEEYVQSEEGRKVYQYNCGCFNWADFVQHVPKELCIKHGLLRCDDELAEETVDWDEELVSSLE